MEILRRRRKSVLEKENLKLQEWFRKQPHLPSLGDIDNELLMAFVTGTRSLDLAKQKLDNYYTQRGMVPQLFDFSVRDPLREEFKEAAEALKLMILPKSTHHGYRVCFGAVNKDFSKFNQRLFEVRFIMICELALVMYPDMIGLIFVFDMEGVDYNFLGKLAPCLFIHWFKNTMPLKMKKGLCFNAPPFSDNVMIFIKPLVKREVSKRLTITSRDKEVLKEHLPADMLPSDYGGTEKSSDELNDYWLDLFEKRREWFYKTSFHHSDEKKRPLNNMNEYGVEGTFRNLPRE